MLQQFAEFLLRRRLVREREAPHCVRWVRRFLNRAATDEPLADRVRRFCEELERGGSADWQVRQAGQALEIYFRQFLGRTDWLEPVAAQGKRGPNGVEPLGAVEQLRRRVQTRHYSYRTEKTYCDWVRRFLDYLAEQQATKRPVVDSQAIQGFLTHLATRRHVSASTQNQALSAVLFLCRHVLGVEVGGLSRAIQAKRGTRLPVVLSVSETTALLEAMSGRTWLMAALVYGGGLRISECCQLRRKDIDFDQGLVFVRSGKGDKDRSTLLADRGRPQLRAQFERADALHRADRAAGLAGVWMPDALERKYPNAGRSAGWFWVFPSQTLSTDPRAGVVRRHHVSESTLQKAVKRASVTAQIHKPVTVHTLRQALPRTSC